MELKSQEMRKLAPELDPLRIGTGWKKEDLETVSYTHLCHNWDGKINRRWNILFDS